MILKNTFRFSQIKAPSIDLTRYLTQQPGWKQDCKKIREVLSNYGLFNAKDPRIDYSKSVAYTKQMQRYFEVRQKQLQQGIKMDLHQYNDPTDPLPYGLHYGYNEVHSSYKEEKLKLKPPHQPVTPITPIVEPGLRYHWIHKSSKNIIPKDVQFSTEVMEDWCGSLFQTGITIAEMIAQGLELPKDALSKYIINGPTYLSPPGLDLNTSKLGDVIGGFHRDVDLLTIHGKAKYAGLYAWMSTGEKFPVSITEGHLLVQAGMQLEWLTGGFIKAGFHEVVHSELVEKQKQQAIKKGESTWRISNSTFCHVGRNMSLRPLEIFRTPEVEKVYRDITADEFMFEELKGFYVNETKN